MFRVLVFALLAGACSKGADAAHDLCARGCKKLLTCAKAGGEEELASCIQACVADKPPERSALEALERTSCDALHALPGT